jgi:hypothetical protein
MPVKPEDLDWMIYHLISAVMTADEEDLVKETGCPPGEVRESLGRLVSYCLISQVNGKYQVLSVQEMLLRAQCKYSNDLPFIIENGVVKARKPGQ